MLETLFTTYFISSAFLAFCVGSMGFTASMLQWSSTKSFLYLALCAGLGPVMFFYHRRRVKREGTWQETAMKELATVQADLIKNIAVYSDLIRQYKQHQQAYEPLERTEMN